MLCFLSYVYFEHFLQILNIILNLEISLMLIVFFSAVQFITSMLLTYLHLRKIYKVLFVAQ